MVALLGKGGCAGLPGICAWWHFSPHSCRSETGFCARFIQRAATLVAAAHRLHPGDRPNRSTESSSTSGGARGHRHLRLPDHPRDRRGRAHCPVLPVRSLRVLAGRSRTASSSTSATSARNSGRTWSSAPPLSSPAVAPVQPNRARGQRDGRDGPMPGCPLGAKDAARPEHRYLALRPGDRAQRPVRFQVPLGSEPARRRTTSAIRCPRNTCSTESTYQSLRARPAGLAGRPKIPWIVPARRQLAKRYKLDTSPRSRATCRSTPRTSSLPRRQRRNRRAAASAGSRST